MSGRAFVNFRVGDAEHAAVLIDQKLCRAFGEDKVFRSSRSMRAGTAFPPQLVAEASGCAVMLVVIGRRWLDIVDDAGRRRIDQPADWVRTELELALAASKPVIPVLTEDRKHLNEDDQLPASITALLDRHYLRLHHRSAELDLVRVVDEVRPYVVRRDGGTAMPQPAAPMLLTTLRPTRRSMDVKLGAAAINGLYYADSIVFRCDLYANDQIGAISFNLSKRYRRFEATAGVLDDAREADQVGVFKVVADGAVLATVTARQGEPRFLTADVTDVLSLRLEAHRPGTTASPLLAGANLTGGISNKLPELAWGNPVVHP
jgi:hypothetical protein